MVARALRAPLIVKLLGANLLVAFAALAAQYEWPGTLFVAPLIVMLSASFIATSALVWIALRPIAQLDATAERVSAGDFSARVPQSLLADSSVRRLSATMNRLLERVEADRARIEYLAGRSVRARDIERESVARELRESLAQMVSGIALGLAAARRTNTDPAVDGQLASTRQMVEDLTEQMRDVAETLYPGTIAELGLANALRSLGRVVERRSGLAVSVLDDGRTGSLAPTVAAALYRVGDEALRNAAQHAKARTVTVLLSANEEAVRLEIEDDGSGFDLRERDPLQAGLGLFSAKTVLALAGGELQIAGAPGRGTRVVAHIPREASTPRSWQVTSSR
jgi:two-component system sensor histidine kinase UhpB